jgi:hypothetical protein
MTARSLGNPVLVFMPHTVHSRIDQTLELLKRQPNIVTPRAGIDRSRIDELVLQKDWTELSACIEDLPAGRIESFRQIAFLEMLRKERPNFVSYYDPSNSQELKEHIVNRLAGVALTLLKQHAHSVQGRIQRKRNPVGTVSLEDLVQGGFVISPPFRQVPVDNAAFANRPLVSLTPGKQGVLAESLLGGRSVLLLGAPGLGKTTNCLLAFQEVLRTTASDVSAQTVIYGSWRELTVATGFPWASSEELVRLILGMAFDRQPWPAVLPLPNRKWIIILDGMDEAALDAEEVAAALEVVGRGATILASCRRHDFERQLQRASRQFDLILELELWEANNINAFVGALRKAGKSAAAEFIERHANNGLAPSFINLPLWLNMLAFLADRPGMQQQRLQRAASRADYDLLRLCVDAVAEDELRRHAVNGDGAILRHQWSLVAWEWHRAWRERQSLLLGDVAGRVGVDFDTPLGKAVLSFLDTQGSRIVGFVHQVFQEYWLAEYLVDCVAGSQVVLKELAVRFSYQRSVITNRLMRARCTTVENRDNLTNRLRESFFAASALEQREQFAKNQIIYLLGRIDDGDATKSFLSLIWESASEPPFVKYSAAFAGIMQGNGRIEEQYYALLRSSEEYERMNRGYHLYYYGDKDLRETQMPPVDDGSGEAEATLRQLFRRLGRTEQRHRNLRRIELLTIRRFLETGRHVPSGVLNVGAIITQVIREAEDWRINQEYLGGVRDEGAQILKLLS